MNPAEAYILNQPEPYKSILLHLQIIIEQTVSGVNLKYKYRIPFYYLKGRPFCYLNASHKKQFVDVGLPKAGKLTLHTQHMVAENRKIMKSLRYHRLEDIDNSILIDVLNETKQLY